MIKKFFYYFPWSTFRVFFIVLSVFYSITLSPFTAIVFFVLAAFFDVAESLAINARWGAE